MHPGIEPGTIIDERYRVEKELGAGASSVVYLVEDIQLGRPLALKLIDLPMGESEELIGRLQREAKALNRFEHPHIVHVYRIGLHGDHHMYLAMEYVAGESLWQMLQRGPLSFNEAVRLALQVAEALHHAEKGGVTHRDLKPHNVLIGIEQQSGATVAKLADFGLCKLNDDQTGTMAQLTRTGVALGTPIYMSPEQCFGQQVDVRSDIYAFGCTMFEMLTGFPPFTGDTPAELLTKHVSEPPPKVLDGAPRSGLPVELQDVYLQCMAKHPGDRYQSFSEVIAALKDIHGSSDRRLKGDDTHRLKRHLNRLKMTPLVKALLLVSVCAALSGLLVCYAATGSQKGLVICAVAKRVAPQRPIPVLKEGLRLVYALNGPDVARAAADVAVSRDGLTNGSAEQKAALNDACMQFFQQKGQPAHAAAFAQPLLFYYVDMLHTARSASPPQVAAAAVVDKVKSLAEFFTQSEIPREYWISLNQKFGKLDTDFSFAGFFPQDEYPEVHMLLQELDGLATVKSGSLASGHHYRRGMAHYLLAIYRARETKNRAKFDSYLNSIATAKSAEKEAYFEITARLQAAEWDVQEGWLADARKQVQILDTLVPKDMAVDAESIRRIAAVRKRLKQGS